MKYYCGPFYLPKFIRKVISKNFNLPCKFHDEQYNLQVSKRKDIDRDFLLDMMSLVEDGKGTSFGAYTMYYLVRYVIGWPSWYMIKLYRWMGFKL
jgi:hypothetical protein